MGKKNNKSGSQLGRAIIRDRFGNGRGRQRRGDPTSLHTSDLQDGYDWGRLNLQSVTEQSQLNEFLATAELAGTEFTAEKLNVTFVKAQSTYGLLSTEEKLKVKKAQDDHASLLKVPRRPLWDKSMSGEELQQLEREAFMAWRKGLSELQEIEGITLTPYEKNLEFWRQLWRVIERSDVIVQIVDARNPLLFRCRDLELYVRETGGQKMNLILINKADFLSEKQRQFWAEYFDSIDLPVAFFSALEENQAHQMRLMKINEDEDEDDSNEEETDESDQQYSDGDDSSDGDDEAEAPAKPVATVQPKEIKSTDVIPGTSDTGDVVTTGPDGRIRNSSRLLTRGQLMDLLKTIHRGHKVQGGTRTVAGLVGYPNVGKSSTINSLLTYKKVSVSATPGKTKHFQTLNIDEDLMLCDCPGLVMPSFVSTKHEMVIWGILPIDQMRDHVGPVNLIASLIPRPVLESTYGIFIPKPSEGEDQDRPPTSEEVLNAYGFMRGFMTARGLPDNPRSSRHILKDFVQGKLLYCVAPPSVEQQRFLEFSVAAKKKAADKVTVKPTPIQLRVTRTNFVNAQTVDQAFFDQANASAHSKGRAAIPGTTHTCGVAEHASLSHASSTTSLESKPWKKHNKRNKKEKLRRVYAHLDQ